MTDETKEGFLFDMGGHVIFSHYDFFDELIDSACGVGEESWTTHQRVSYVWLKQRWVPYPFQNNLYALDDEDKISCINGVLDAKQVTAKPTNFDEWILKVMGEGIANLFMRPYNFKVWAYPTHEMQCEWLGERVATVDAKKVIANVVKNQPDAGWGPNAVFRFPTAGGTGGIWKRVGKLLPQEKCRYHHRIVKIDAEAKEAHYVYDPEWIAGRGDSSAGGLEVQKIKYNKLLSTIPLDEMMKWTDVDPKQELPPLDYSSTHVVGIGLRGLSPHELKCWLYYPEDDCPFYRCTVFSHYAVKNCPPKERKLATIQVGNGKDFAVEDASEREGPYWSLMFEISESAKHKPVKPIPELIQETIQGAINTTLISPKEEIVSIYHRRLEKGYPTPHVNRDTTVNKVLPILREKHDIWSRGRFGSWKYEVGNQDHTCMLGVEAVDNMLYGTKEFSLLYPDQTNRAKNKDLHYEYDGQYIDRGL